MLGIIYLASTEKDSDIVRNFFEKYKNYTNYQFIMDIAVSSKLFWLVCHKYESFFNKRNILIEIILIFKNNFEAINLLRNTNKKSE